MRKFWWWLNNICWVHYSLIAHWARSVAAKVVSIMSLQSYWYLVAAGRWAVSCDQLLAFYPALTLSHRGIPAIGNELVQKSWYFNICVHTVMDKHYQYSMLFQNSESLCAMWRKKRLYILISNIPATYPSYLHDLNTTMKRPQAPCVSLARGNSWPRWQDYTQKHFLH